MREFRLLIFDLDGTIIDSEKDLAAAVNHTRSLYDMPPLDIGRVRVSIGDGVTVLLQRTLPGLHEKEISQALIKFRAYYGEHLLDNTRLYPGIQDVLERSSDVEKAVLTNKSADFSNTLLERLGIARHFALVRGGDRPGPRKPHPQPVLDILNHFKVSKDKAILIGDSSNDFLSARAAGIKSGLVGYGYTDPAVLEDLRPDYFFSKPEDIAAKLAAA